MPSKKYIIIVGALILISLIAIVTINYRGHLISLGNRFFASISLVETTNGTTYYVDATAGNDINNGTSSSSAWKTIAKVNSMSFNPGDYILFKRGEIWREQLIVPSSGTAGKPITFGAYGSGEKPKITAFDLATNWTGPDGNGEYTHSEAIRAYIFLEDGNNLLKTTVGLLKPGEWAYDSKKIYYRPTSGSPSAHILEKGIRNTAIILDSKEYIVFDNLHLEGQNTPGENTQGVLYGAGVSHITVQNCDVYFGRIYGIRFQEDSQSERCFDINIINNNVKRNGGRNITIQKTDTALIKGNHVFESGINNYQTNADMEGIAAGYSSNVTIEDNIIHDNGRPNINDTNYGKGIVIFNVESGSIIIRRNKVYNNQHSGIRLGGDYPNTTITISYNLIYNNGLNELNRGSGGVSGYYGGIVMGCYDNNCGTVNIYNNVIWKNNGNNEENDQRQGNVFALVGNGMSITINLKNNIIGEWQNTLYGSDYNFQKSSTSSFTITSNYNLIYRTTLGKMVQWVGLSNTPYTKDNWSQYVIDSSQDINSLNKNPLFANESINDFHLQFGSPAINAGVSVGLTSDFAGNPIIGLPDIGAYEYQGTVIDATPPSPPTGVTVN